MSSILVKPRDAHFSHHLGAVDIPFRAAWRRAHFLGGSAAESTANMVDGANPLTVVGAPAYTPGYAIVSIADGFKALDKTAQFDRTSVIVMSTPWCSNTPEFQAGLYKPAGGVGTPEQGYNNPASDLATWPALWFSNRYDGIFLANGGWTAQAEGAREAIYPTPTFLLPFPPSAIQRPDMSIAPPRNFFALYLTTDIARGKVIYHVTQGYSILRVETTLGGPVPVDAFLHVAGVGGGAGGGRQAVAFIGEAAALPDAAIPDINDWLWAELADVGVER